MCPRWWDVSPGDDEAPESRGERIQGLGGSHGGGNEPWSGDPIVSSPWQPARFGPGGSRAPCEPKEGLRISHQIMCFIDRNFPLETQ